MGKRPSLPIKSDNHSFLNCHFFQFTEKISQSIHYSNSAIACNPLAGNVVFALSAFVQRVIELNIHSGHEPASDVAMRHLPHGTSIGKKNNLGLSQSKITNPLNMKKIFNLLLVILFVVSIADAQKSDPYLTKSLSSNDIQDVYARTSGGNIYVEGVSSGEARIEVYITENNNRSISKEEIRKRLEEDYKMSVEASGSKLTAVAEPKSNFRNWKNALSISFKIYVPSKVSTDLVTSGGNIELRDLSGTHNFSTSGGGLYLSKITGKTRGKTSGGGITVKDSKDDIALSTSGGGIEASNCTGNLRLNTSGGRIDLNQLNGEIEVHTSGGSIRGEQIRGNLYARTSGGRIELGNLSCGVDASTSGGSVSVEVVEVAGAVTLSNSGGNISLKMPANKGLDLRLRGSKINTVDLTNFSGDKEDDRLVGKVNGGGVAVNVSTSGNITFSMTK